MKHRDEHGVLLAIGIMSGGFLLFADISWNMKILFLFSAAVGFLFGLWYADERVKGLIREPSSQFLLLLRRSDPINRFFASTRQKGTEAELDDVDDQWEIVDPEDAQDGLERRKRE